ncbi:unnamed protein product [Adineta ricciae]|uniref:Zinc transporter 1 n=1 Tax=Adineta ricciae TaxID=249248 RepID=A0A814SBX0_ADIRI|nr:unnamed protein product [Adineta ricciae]CAF1145331.1 unnamed protein product [Adineta ricciae]
MSSSKHEHSHDHHHEHHGQRRLFCRTKTFRLLVMLTLTFGFFIVELIVGNLTKSVALVADAFHMLSDVISLVIGIVAVRIVKRRSNANTYGWVRAEVVGANVNTVFLLALCLTIIFDAVKRFIEPEPIENVNLLLIVGSIGLGINVIGLFLFQGFHGHSHGGHSHGHSKVEHNGNNLADEHSNSANRFERHSTRALQEVIADSVTQADQNPSDVVIDIQEKQTSKKKASMNMHGVFLHVLADALGSVVVIISALIIKFVPHDKTDNKHWTVYIDPSLSVIIVIIITISTIPLFRDTSSILLQTVPKHLEVQRIKSELLEAVPEISSVHELHIWRLTDEKIIASAHLHRKTLANYMSVADKVKKFFHLIGIHSVTMQYECDDDYHQTPTLHRTSFSETKIAGDCLLRCDDNACDTQTCCTIVSARSNTLLSNQDADFVENPVQFSSISRTFENRKPVEDQTSSNKSFVNEKF